MKQFAIDMAYKSLNHCGEELCGDKVEIVDKEDSRILILADGMGSGIRANILATLTSKIIATMMYNDMTIDEVVATIAKTLPLSSINGVAYSTFSIIQVYHTGEIYVAEYDNPECILIRQGKLKALPFSYRKIEGKRSGNVAFRRSRGMLWQL
ncbi:MAG: SpoIIE family protein phosphatase [Eubacterium ramulus]|uniref:SpoIIE family protein phosphatase n=1 Tax=Eubacterium ramulus TaxID=39490 RepID=UPI00399FFE83